MMLVGCVVLLNFDDGDDDGGGVSYSDTQPLLVRGLSILAHPVGRGCQLRHVRSNRLVVEFWLMLVFVLIGCLGVYLVGCQN